MQEACGDVCMYVCMLVCVHACMRVCVTVSVCARAYAVSTFNHARARAGGFLSLNPGQKAWFTLSPDDSIVVLGELSK
jgi:hypothetical protein